MKLKITFMGLAALFFMLLIQGIPEGADKKPIRIAYLQNDIHHLPCWVAMEKGFYAREGLEVQVAGVFKAGSGTDERLCRRGPGRGLCG